MAYSLSGLVYVKAIVLGKRNIARDSMQRIAECINGIIFLSTPFTSLNLAK